MFNPIYICRVQSKHMIKFNEINYTGTSININIDQHLDSYSYHLDSILQLSFYTATMVK